MAATLEQVTTAALALSFEEREQLIAKLLESDEEAPLSEAWQAEIKRRMEEIENGAPTYSLEEVMAELKQKYP